MEVKKHYQELVDFLQANELKQVKTILDTVYSMTEKKRESIARYNDAGEVVEIFCYYHKQWENLSSIEYGIKKGSSTGYNTQCRLGQRAYAKIHRASAEVDKEAIALLISGELRQEELKQWKEDKIKLITDNVWNTHQHKGVENERTTI